MLAFKAIAYPPSSLRLNLCCYIRHVTKDREQVWIYVDTRTHARTCTHLRSPSISQCVSRAAVQCWDTSLNRYVHVYGTLSIPIIFIQVHLTEYPSNTARSISSHYFFWPFIEFFWVQITFWSNFKPSVFWFSTKQNSKFDPWRRWNIIVSRYFQNW